MQDGMRLAIIYGDGRRKNVLHDKNFCKDAPSPPPLGLNSGSPLSIHNLNLTLPEKIVGICYVVLCSHYFGCMKWTSQCLLYRGWYQILSSNRGWWQAVLGGDGWVLVFYFITFKWPQNLRKSLHSGLKQIIFYTNRNNLQGIEQNHPCRRFPSPLSIYK